MEPMRISLSMIDPDPKNVRKRFDGIGSLAATFSSNAIHPGEPFIPIIVAPYDADGSTRYRIIDGERRFKAMQSVGTEECECLVDGSAGALDAVAIMLATDHKQTLLEDESAAGIQTALFLGMDADNVASLARDKRITRDKVDRLAKAQRGVGKATQMSMNDLIRLSDVEDERKRIELARLMEKGDDSAFKTELSAYENEQSTSREYERIVSKLDEAGVAYVHDVPEGHRLKTRLYGVRYHDASHVAESCEGCVVYMKRREECHSPYGIEPVLYVARDADAETDRDRLLREYREMKDVVDAEFGKAMKERFSWVADNLSDVAMFMRGSMECKDLADLFWGAVMDFIDDSVDDVFSAKLRSLKDRVSATDVGLFWSFFEDGRWNFVRRDVAYKRVGQENSPEVEDLKDYICMVDALRFAGYVPCSEEESLCKTISEIIGGNGDGDE